MQGLMQNKRFRDHAAPIGWIGLSGDGHINKFRTGEFPNAIPVFTHSEQVNDNLLTVAKRAILALDASTAHLVDAGAVLDDLIEQVREAGELGSRR